MSDYKLRVRLEEGGSHVDFEIEQFLTLQQLPTMTRLQQLNPIHNICDHHIWDPVMTEISLHMGLVPTATSSWLNLIINHTDDG